MNTQELKKNAAELGVSEDVYIFLRQSNRKIRYFSCDLKRERIIIDGERVLFIPSREDSYDRLLEEGMGFASEEKSVEETAEDSILHQQLWEALGQLNEGERRLIDEIFYQGKSEKEIAQSLEITQQTVSYRKHIIIDKLKKLMKV